ncbi:hypothetical protein SCA6_006521 [Theobroma cacao]
MMQQVKKPGQKMEMEDLKSIGQPPNSKSSCASTPKLWCVNWLPPEPGRQIERGQLYYSSDIKCVTKLIPKWRGLGHSTQ